MRRPAFTRLHIPPVLSALAALGIALGACSDDPVKASGDTDAIEDADTSDVPDLTGKSVYRMEFTIDGEPIVIDRDLSGLDQYFAFGSTHIAPAVSFGMTDSIQFPRTMTISINFGIVVPSTDHAIQTEGIGTHPFSTEPPSIDLFVKGLQYRSSLEGATGAMEITDWGVEEGDVVAGTFQGKVIAEGPTGRTIDLSGSFHFVLPAKNAGQPQ